MDWDYTYPRRDVADDNSRYTRDDSNASAAFNGSNGLGRADLVSNQVSRTT